MLRSIESRRARSFPAVVVVAISSLIIVAVLLPAVWSYPSRLQRFRERQFAQDGYFNYYDANFHPSEIARALAEATKPDEGFRVFFPEEDHFTLAYACYRQGVALDRDATRVRVYAVFAPQTDRKKLAAAWGSDGQELLADAARSTDTGYFRLWRSKEPLPLAVLDRATENRPENH